MTINAKLFLIVATNTAMLVLVGTIGYLGINSLSKDQASTSQLGEIVHSHMQADMMHDALRAGVFGSIMAGNKVIGAPDAEETLAEVAENAEILQAAIAKNRSRITNPAQKASLEETLPALDGYVAAANQISNLAIKTSELVDQAQVDRFLAAFEALEEKLGTFGDLVANDASITTEKAQKNATQAVSWMGAILVISVLVSLALSWYLGRSINQHLQAVMKNLSKRGEATQRMNEKLDGLAQAVAASATEQAAAVQESVASMAEMSSMISQTVDGATRSMEAAQQATHRTEDGSRIMTEMVASMESIQQANQQLRDMAAIIQEISVKTGVINDIVFKTQLLAFNASIEAARAGQHGRGFAVVAEEVGNLADMSGNAAKEIQTLLDSSQKQVSNMVEITEQRVTQGRAVSEQAMVAFSQIAKDIATISSQVQSINDAMKEQEAGVQQTQTAMTQIDTAAQQTSQASVGVSKSVGELKQETQAVNSIIATLRQMVVGASTKPGVTEIIELDSDVEAPRRETRWNSTAQAKDWDETRID